MSYLRKGKIMFCNGFKESDWKLFRERVPYWQEAYIAKLNCKYIEILNSDKLDSEKFWEIEKRINSDKNSAGVIIEMRRSELITNILELLSERVIAPNDLEEFSDELKQTVNLLWTEADNK